MLSDRRWRWDNSDTWHLQQELHLYPRINYFYSVKVAGQNVTFPRDLLSLGTESAVADVEERTPWCSNAVVSQFPPGRPRIFHP